MRVWNIDEMHIALYNIMYVILESKFDNIRLYIYYTF